MESILCNLAKIDNTFLGCKEIPGPKSKYCQTHAKLDSPAITSDDVSLETRKKL